METILILGAARGAFLARGTLANAETQGGKGGGANQAGLIHFLEVIFFESILVL